MFWLSSLLSKIFRKQTPTRFSRQDVPHSDLTIKYFGVTSDCAVNESSVALGDVDHVGWEMRQVWGDDVNLDPISAIDYSHLMGKCIEYFGDGINAVAAYVVVRNSKLLWEQIAVTAQNHTGRASDSHAAYQTGMLIYNLRLAFEGYTKRDDFWKMLIGIYAGFSRLSIPTSFHKIDHALVLDLWDIYGAVNFNEVLAMHDFGMSADDIRAVVDNGIDIDTAMAATVRSFE